MSAGNQQQRKLKPEEVDDFDELLTETLDDFANPNLLKGVLPSSTGGAAAGTGPSTFGASSVEALRENASSADLLKPLAGLSFSTDKAVAGSDEASGTDIRNDESVDDELLSRLESDFGQLDKVVQDLLKETPEDSSDPDVSRLKAELRDFASKVDTATPAEIGDALASTLRSLNESVSAHSRHADAVHLPKPSEGAASASAAGGGRGSGNTDEVLMPFMENLMHTLLSKDVIYPSLRSIRDSYPGWLEQNASKMSKSEVDKAKQRIHVIKQVCDQYEALGDAKPSEEQFDRILLLVQHMQSLGPPPEELLSDGDLPNVMPQCPQM